MRIAMVSEHASPLAVLGGVDAGGQNVHVAELALALARRGASVCVHTRRDDQDLPRRCALGPGVEVDHVAAGPAGPVPKDELLPHMDAFAAQLAEQWRRAKPDVVHAHFWMSGLAALKAADAVGGIPVVQTFHALGVVKRRYQGGKDTSPPARLEAERDILQRAAHVIATCTDEVFELLRLDASRQKLTVVPCGADLQRFTPDGGRHGVPPRRRGVARVACVGRLVERKGVGTVISALRAMGDDVACELVIAGGPDASDMDRDPEVRRLRALAEAEGVADRVTFLGRLDRDGTAAVMRSADVVASVPWYEPFGIVPIEAMACGTPVVASAVGGMIDTVVDGVTGLHVPPRDPERLADALAPLLADPDRRARLGRAGVERARRLYDWDRVGAATLDVYARVAERRRARFRRSAGAQAGAAGPRRCPTPAATSPRCARADRRGGRARPARGVGRAAGLHAVRAAGAARRGQRRARPAEAQHLTAELAGRYVTDRQPLSAICLHGDTSALTAIANDFGWEEAFARQVRAHGRPGDVLVALSTSGRSPNVLAAVRAARECGLRTWALTGPGPNALADLADDALALPGTSTATVQELHLVAVHVLCGRSTASSRCARPRAVAARRPGAADRRIARA
jgi:type III pantothenate kinase